MVKLATVLFGLGTLFAGCLAFAEIAVDLDAAETFKALWTLYVLTAVCLWLHCREEKSYVTE